MKTTKPQNTAFLIILLFCTIMNSCASKKNLIQENEILESKPKLLFLNYTISESNNGVKNIQFINKIIADGKLKNNTYPNEGVYGDLICNQLDKNKNKLQSIIIKNPLIKTVEYVNDSLNFESRILKLKSAPISLRLQLNEKTEQIVIGEIIDSLHRTKHLITTKLKIK